MGLSGDFAGLAQLQQQLEEIVSAGFTEELKDVLGATALKQVDDSFRHSRDPYDEDWRPLALRAGKPLEDTGQMAASANYQTTAEGFKINIPKLQAPVHQKGATIVPVRAKALRFKVGNRWYRRQKVTIPRRAMVPDHEGGGLGPVWGKAFADEAAALIRRKLVL